jgi:hypothetical protein
MRLLTNAEELSKSVRVALTKYRFLRWSVAWASYDFPLCKLLLRHRDRIEQLIVGTHFYQTHPDFLAALVDHANLRVVLLPSGVFHPKIYFFENDQADWACIAGSANFSDAAFARNVEFSTYFDSKAPNAADLYGQIREALDQHWVHGSKLTQTALRRYRVLRSHYRPKLIQMAGDFGARAENIPPIEIDMFGWDWPSFVRRVRRDRRQDLVKRLAVLSAIRRFFEEDRQLVRMTVDQRERIAGIAADEDDLPWRYFGSMFPAGLFKNAFAERFHVLSKALDAIPLEGDVTRTHYDRYLTLFQRAFPSGGAGVGGASRLLCMKRPDVFLCVNSKNRAGLCRALGIPKTDITYSTYWDEIVQRIQATAWWNTSHPRRGIETEIWRGRTALLDALYYDPSAT